MPREPQLPGKVAHGGKDGDDFLGVVQDVIGFLADLHQHVDRMVIGRREPAVLRIELVAEDEAECGHDFPWRFRRQRSEQYLTSAQTAAHFLRQKYGRPQQRQILLGKCVFLLDIVKRYINKQERTG